MLLYYGPEGASGGDADVRRHRQRLQRGLVARVLIIIITTITIIATVIVIVMIIITLTLISI